MQLNQGKMHKEVTRIQCWCGIFIRTGMCCGGREKKSTICTVKWHLRKARNRPERKKKSEMTLLACAVLIYKLKQWANVSFNMPSSWAENCASKRPDDFGPVWQAWNALRACRALAELLGCERNGRWKSLLSCTHSLNTTGSLRSQFTDLKVFICCPAKEILDWQLSLGNFCTRGFLVLVFLLTLVISPTGMPSPCSVWISPLEALAKHPSSKGIVCFSSEFLSHLSDSFLFGTNPWSFLFCWLSFQLYAF